MKTTTKKSFLHVPDEVLSREDLDWYEKGMLGHITSFPICYTTNKQFQLMFTANERTISRKIKSLSLRGEIMVGKIKGKRTLSLPPTDFKSIHTDFKSTPSKTQESNKEKTQHEELPVAQAEAPVDNPPSLRCGDRVVQEVPVESRILKYLNEEELEEYNSMTPKEQCDFLMEHQIK